MTYKIEYDQIDAAARILYAKKAAADKFGYPVRMTDDNRLFVATQDMYGAYPTINKFGSAPDFDTGDGEVTIWDGADDGGIAEMQYNYSSTADIDSVSSSDAGDSQDVEIQGLDSNYALTVQTVTLNGQTAVTMGTNLIRVFRVKNVGSVDLTGDAYVYVGTSPLSGGIPTTTSTVRAIAISENNQTEMAIYTVPSGYTGYFHSMYVRGGGASRTAEYIFRIKARPFGQVFQLKYRGSFDDDVERGHDHHWASPIGFPAKTDIAVTCELITGAVSAALIIAGFDMVLIPD